jgi:hypothetical protein
MTCVSIVLLHPMPYNTHLGNQLLHTLFHTEGCARPVCEQAHAYMLCKVVKSHMHVVCIECVACTVVTFQR